MLFNGRSPFDRHNRFAFREITTGEWNSIFRNLRGRLRQVYPNFRKIITGNFRFIWFSLQNFQIFWRVSHEISVPLLPVPKFSEFLVKWKAPWPYFPPLCRDGRAYFERGVLQASARSSNLSGSWDIGKIIITPSAPGSAVPAISWKNGYFLHSKVLIENSIGENTNKWFSIEYRQIETKTQVNTLTNHKEHRTPSEPIKKQSKFMELTKSAGKRMQAGHNRFWFYLVWLDGKVAWDFKPIEYRRNTKQIASDGKWWTTE